MERLTGEQRAISRLEGQLGANHAQVLAFLQIVGEAEIAPEWIGAKLVEIGLHFRDLQAQMGTTPGDDPAVARLKAQMEEALGRGDLDRADALLGAEAQRAQDEAADTKAREALERALAAGGDPGAAGRDRARPSALPVRQPVLFAEAAGRVPPGHWGRNGSDYLEEARSDALYRQGHERAEDAALKTAVKRYREIAQRSLPAQDPLMWIRVQNKLGLALLRLGEQKGTKAYFQEAVAVLSRAVVDPICAQHPLEWARTYTNLGVGFRAIRQAGTFAGQP